MLVDPLAGDVKVNVGITVDRSVVAVAIDGDEVSVMMKVDVAGGSRVGVAGIGVGDAHAVTTAVMRANPNRRIANVFSFIMVTSTTIISFVNPIKKSLTYQLVSDS
jgi:hypothetical protein